MRKFSSSRIVEFLFFCVLIPISVTRGTILHLLAIIRITTKRPKFNWAIFRYDDSKLLEALQLYLPVGKAVAKDVLLFSGAQKVASNTYIGDNQIVLRARAWTPTPWAYLGLAFLEWVIIFEFNQNLVHISNNPSKNYRVASALQLEENLPDVFRNAILTNIVVRLDYKGP